jgi:hypothetical protein
MSLESRTLPALVRRYLDRALPASGPKPRRVRLAQKGQMWLKPGGRALPFTAVEEFAVKDVAFSWEARVRSAPMVSMHVVDRFATGEGVLEARLFGLVPVMRAKGREVSEGELVRYLAELAWVPHAMLENPQLEWRELTDDTVEVATRLAAIRVSVRIAFDSDGDIARSSTDARPRAVGEELVPTPWAGTFRDYAVVGGVRVPTRGEVRWELPDGPFTYWRGEITSLELDPSD